MSEAKHTSPGAPGLDSDLITRYERGMDAYIDRFLKCSPEHGPFGHMLETNLCCAALSYFSMHNPDIDFRLITRDMFVSSFPECARERGSKLSDGVLRGIAGGCWDRWRDSSVSTAVDRPGERRELVDWYLMMRHPFTGRESDTLLDRCGSALCVWLRRALAGKLKYMAADDAKAYTRDDMSREMTTLARRYGSMLQREDILEYVDAHWDEMRLRAGLAERPDQKAVPAPDIPDDVIDCYVGRFIEACGYSGEMAAVTREWMPKMIKDPSAFEGFVKAAQAANVG